MEELCLCKAWATTSDEGISGGENSNAYWEMVHTKWSLMEGMNGDVRTFCSLHQKLKEIKSEVLMFHSCFLKAKSSLPSDSRDAIEIALKFFLSERSRDISTSKRKKKPVKVKGFQFSHCWDYLQDTRKFKAIVESKRGEKKKRKLAAAATVNTLTRRQRKRDEQFAREQFEAQRQDMHNQTTVFQDLSEHAKLIAVALRKQAAAQQFKVALEALRVPDNILSMEHKKKIIELGYAKHLASLEEDYPDQKKDDDEAPAQSEEDHSNQQSMIENIL